MRVRINSKGSKNRLDKLSDMWEVVQYHIGTLVYLVIIAGLVIGLILYVR